MGKYSIVFAENTIKELEKHKRVGNKGINTKIDKIFNELKNTPFTGEGQPEPLKIVLQDCGHDASAENIELFIE